MTPIDRCRSLASRRGRSTPRCRRTVSAAGARARRSARDVRPALDARLTRRPASPSGSPASCRSHCSSSSGARRSTAWPATALHAIKYGGEQRLADPLGAAVARRWAAVGVGADVVVHVPGPRRPRAAARLRPGGADRAGRGAPPRPAVSRRCLVRDAGDDRPVRPRPARPRAPTSRGAFARPTPGCATRTSPGRWVLLVDDVVTTGLDARGRARRRSRSRRRPRGRRRSTVARER